MTDTNSSMTPTGVPANVHAARPHLKRILVGPPPGLTDQECGTGESLVGRVEGYPAFTSYWKPDAEQLALLNAGGVIELVQYVPHMVMHSMSIWPAAPAPCSDPNHDVDADIRDALLDAEIDHLLNDGMCPNACGRKVAVGRLMCGRCWAQVPKDLQTEVYAAWRAMNRELTGENIARHREAKYAAVRSVR